MNYTTWMSETKRGVTTPRSTALKAVDAAFQAANDTQTCGTAAGTNLVNALKAWVAAQAAKGGNWRTSTRNATKDLQNRGTVERLMRDLQAKAMFAGTFAQHLNAVAPVVAQNTNYAPGKWQSVKDDDGNWHEFFYQEKGNSCVCASIVMMKRMINSLAASQLSEQEIRGVLALAETGNLNEGISSVGIAAQNHHKWDTTGTNLTQALKTLQVKPHSVSAARQVAGNSGQGLLDTLNAATPKRPAMIAWLWSGGGGHATVCIGPTKDGGRLKILDPWTGIQYIDNNVNNYTSYANTGTLLWVIATH